MPCIPPPDPPVDDGLCAAVLEVEPYGPPVEGVSCVEDVVEPPSVPVVTGFSASVVVVVVAVVVDVLAEEEPPRGPEPGWTLMLPVTIVVLPSLRVDPGPAVSPWL
ncbi:MAG: hypothetical protein JW990_14300 [Thermoleophilia bacterium]|nr:hypothetical protein [Thermoleophilia bacterium]